MTANIDEKIFLLYCRLVTNKGGHIRGSISEMDSELSHGDPRWAFLQLLHEITKPSAGASTLSAAVSSSVGGGWMRGLAAY